MKVFAAIWCVTMLLSVAVHAQAIPSWRVEATVGISHFQQQVKQEVGGITGNRLVDETAVGLHVSGAYTLYEYIAVGVFARAERGNRHAARFAGFDSEGRTQVRDAVGGHFAELWLGPVVQLRWKLLSLDIGYGAMGVRSDDARQDLPSSTGDTEAAFTTHPALAWLAALRANVPIVENLDAVLAVEYRFRYYTQRGGNSLVGNIEHGTQSITPLLGVAYRW